MKQATFNAIAGTIFLAIAVLHALRLLRHWEVLIAGWSVPIWVSWVAVVLFGALGYTAIRQSSKK